MSFLDRSWAWVHEFFTLGDAEKRVRNLTLDDRIEIRHEHEAATRLMLEAERAETPQRRVELATAALKQLTSAVAVANRRSSDGGVLDPSDEVAVRQEILGLPGIERHERVLASLIGESRPARLGKQLFLEMAALFGDLELHMDVRTPREFRVTRLFRATAVCVSAACLGWIMVRPTNLARGKPVSASSRCESMPAPPFAEPALSRAVDGVRHESTYAICTEKEVHPFITVDLDAVHAISEIVVYGRSEGNWGLDEVPARLELSTDDKVFETIGRTSTAYMPDLPWTVKLAKKRARFVRLSADSDRAQQFYLNEIEVYGY